MIRKLTGTIILSCIFNVAIAQLRVPKFLIYKTPVKIGQKTIDSLNNVIAYSKKEEDVFELIDRKLSSFHNILIHIKKPFDQKSDEYIDYYIGSPERLTRDLREKTASRGDDTFIYYRSQLKAFFPDTLLVLDTLQIRLRPVDFKYPINRYYLQVGDPGKQTARIGLKGSGERLILTKVPGLAGFRQPVRCVLYNEAYPKPMAAFKLAFVGEEQKGSLHLISLLIRENNTGNPELTPASLTTYLLDYARLRFGMIKGENMKAWILNGN